MNRILKILITAMSIISIISCSNNNKTDKIYYIDYQFIEGSSVK